MSSLRFFADHCIPNSIIKSLEEERHQIFMLKDHIPPDSPDSVVIKKAQELGSILITLDRDFADIVTYPPANFRGIIALQVRDHPEVIPQIMTILKQYLTSNPYATHYNGKLFVVEGHRIRIKE